MHDLATLQSATSNVVELGYRHNSTLHVRLEILELNARFSNTAIDAPPTLSSWVTGIIQRCMIGQKFSN